MVFCTLTPSSHDPAATIRQEGSVSWLGEKPASLDLTMQVTDSREKQKSEVRLPSASGRRS